MQPFATIQPHFIYNFFPVILIVSGFLVVFTITAFIETVFVAMPTPQTLVGTLRVAGLRGARAGNTHSHLNNFASQMSGSRD